MLDIQNCSVVLGRQIILHGINFDLEPGKLTAILGRNGAGKTTLVRALAGLIPYSGTVSIDGKDIRKLRPSTRSRLIGYVAQQGLDTAAQLTVLELLVTAQSTHHKGWSAPENALHEANKVLQALDLGKFAHRLLSQLSGGQRQMVSLALALVSHPEVLLLDEPTSALDLANQIHIFEFVRNYTREHNIATLMILHDPNLVTRFADDVMLLDKGHIAVKGPVDDVMTEDNLAGIYGVKCHVTTLPSGHRVIYPLGFQAV